MTEKDWEEFKKNVIPIEKKNNLLKKKSKEKFSLKKEDKEKFETQFFYGEDEEKNLLEKNTLKRIKKGRLKI